MRQRRGRGHGRGRHHHHHHSALQNDHRHFADETDGRTTEQGRNLGDLGTVLHLSEGGREGGRRTREDPFTVEGTSSRTEGRERRCSGSEEGEGKVQKEEEEGRERKRARGEERAA